MPKKTPGTGNRIALVCKLLNRHRVKYLVAGGMASILHGYLRATKDIDVLVQKDRKNIERLLSALSELPYGIAKELDVDEVLEKPFTIVGDDPRVDVLLAAGKGMTYEKAKDGKIVRNVSGTRVPFLGIEDLIRSKQTGRLQDELDLKFLRRKKKLES